MRRPRPVADPRARLVCLPAADGTASACFMRFDDDHFYVRAREAEPVADIVARMSDCAQASVGHQRLV